MSGARRGPRCMSLWRSGQGRPEACPSTSAPRPGPPGFPMRRRVGRSLRRKLSPHPSRWDVVPIRPRAGRRNGAARTSGRKSRLQLPSRKLRARPVCSCLWERQSSRCGNSARRSERGTNARTQPTTAASSLRGTRGRPSSAPRWTAPRGRLGGWRPLAIHRRA